MCVVTVMCMGVWYPSVSCWCSTTACHVGMCLVCRAWMDLVLVSCLSVVSVSNSFVLSDSTIYLIVSRVSVSYVTVVYVVCLLHPQTGIIHHNMEEMASWVSWKLRIKLNIISIIRLFITKTVPVSVRLLVSQILKILFLFFL